jgi:hypothetical protein
MSSCSFGDPPISTIYFCKPVNAENSNKIFFSMLEFSKSNGLHLVFNKNEIDLSKDWNLNPPNLVNIYGMQKQNDTFVFSFASSDIDRNGYAFSFFRDSEAKYKHTVRSLISKTIETDEIIEFQGNAFSGKSCAAQL